MGSINNIVLHRNKKKYSVSFDFSCDLERFFNNPGSFEQEYDVDIEAVPDSILIVPFVANVLPIIWLTDSSIDIEELDETFFYSIPEFRHGYEEMYPSVKFKGSINVRTLVANKHETNKKLAFFSGGADAYATLVAHAEEKPILVTLRGADVSLDDYEGWENVKKPVFEACKEFGLNHHFISSNFRIFEKEVDLSNWAHPQIKDSWWHGMQHSIGLIAQAAPLCFLDGIGVVYFASSYTIKDRGRITCASDPTIDNFVRFASARVIHDQYDFNTSEKIQHICEYSKSTGRKITLHVCWQSAGGKNCCHCEKCYRRIMEVTAAGANPNDYGFNVDKKIYKRIKRDVFRKITIPVPLWENVKNQFLKNRKEFAYNGDITWIYDVDLKKINRTFFKRLNNKLNRIKSKFV